jgi:hypothetical protein
MLHGITAPFSGSRHPAEWPAFVYDVRDVGASSVQLTRTSFQPPEVVHRTSGHSSTAPRIRHEIRRSLLTLATVALVLGALISAASSQSSGPPAGVQRSGDVGELRVVTPEPAPVVDDVSPASPSGHRRVAPWRDWPRVPGNAVHDGRMMDGAPFNGPDGRMCWPHGDHVHCR